MITDIDLRTYRCKGCGRILFRAVLAPGSLIQDKHKCGVVNVIDVPLTQVKVAV